MFSFSAKQKILIVSIVIVALGLGVFEILNTKAPAVVAPVVKSVEIKPSKENIGKSVEGRNIEAYTYGNGTTSLIFVGGIHGGYEWNSVLLSYMLIDYLDAHPEVIPKNLTIEIIPSVNPDGVYKVTGKEGRFTSADVSTNENILASGRFNSDKVDLNRNFDCKWQPKSTWQSKTVSAGTAAFSEPEAKAIRNFMLKHNPSAVVFWHSQSNGVYASQCQNGILPETLKIMNVYSQASGYPAIKTFDAYPTTGAADDWLASVKIPAVTVELKTHTSVEWSRNLAGIRALIDYYSK